MHMRIKIDNLGRVVIPKGYRDKLGINKGDELDIELTNNTVVLQKADRFCCICGNKNLKSDIPLCSNCINKIKTQDF